MATSGGPNITTEGLVFGYDIGYPLVSSSSDTYKFNRGEPTTNLLTSTEQDPRNWSGRPTADKTLLSETYLGLPVYRLADADGVDPDVYVDNYQNVTAETGLTEGDTYVFSFYFRVIQNNNIADTLANNCAWVWYAGSTDSIFWNDYNLNTWYKAELQATVGATYSQLLPRIDYDNSIVDICGLQFEKKSHATPFTTGTRSVSGSLIDLTRTTDIDLTNVSFDSNAQMTFDGTDDNIDLGDVLDMGTGDLTVEAVFKRTSNNNASQWIMSKSYAGGAISRYWVDNFWHSGNSVYKLRFGASWNSTSHTDYLGNQTLNLDQWYSICVVVDRDDKVFLYIDGELDASHNISTYSGHNSNSSLPYRIGSYTAGNQTSPYGSLSGHIPVYKHYNRALSAQEVKENYNALKSRFELS